MILLAAILVISFFIFFQQEVSNRNMKKFEKSRKRYGELLERLRKRDEGEKKNTGD